MTATNSARLPPIAKHFNHPPGDYQDRLLERVEIELNRRIPKSAGF